MHLHIDMFNLHAHCLEHYELEWMHKYVEYLSVMKHCKMKNSIDFSFINEPECGFTKIHILLNLLQVSYLWNYEKQ